MRNIIAVLALLLCVVVFSVSVVSCNKEPDASSSTLASSMAVTSSMPMKDVSSTIAVPESSSMPQSSSPAAPTSSKSQSASVNTTAPANNSSLVYDINSYAENWTYVIDKSKPVPLQPRVDNSFFSSAMFVGDSITTGIDLYSIIKGAPVVAYTGINTNTVLSRQVIKTSQGKVTFLKQMAKYNPKHIYIMMGINGIAFQSKSNLISGYSAFVDKVKAQHPNAIIYLQSILPVTAKKQNNDSRFANSKINDYNAAIANLAKEKGIYYLNVAEAFKDGSGNLPAAASSDGIHFGPAYYRRWIEYLKTHTVYTGVIPESSAPETNTPETSTPETNTPETSAPEVNTSTSSANSTPSSDTSRIPVTRPTAPPAIKDTSSIAKTEETTTQ